MPTTDHLEHLHVTTIEIDGRLLNVTVNIRDDGIEHVGNLSFADDAWEDEGVRDYGAIPGRDAEEVLTQARNLTATDLTMRFRRAQTNRRRNHELRKITEEGFANLRHLSRVAISLRAGLLEVDDAAAEIEETEKKLLSMIVELKHYAGVRA